MLTVLDARLARAEEMARSERQKTMSDETSVDSEIGFGGQTVVDGRKTKSQLLIKKSG